ncbi:uncharacterized protein G2W53_026295 [Senna tora]|uniref:Uncharacterized protein n=1 Tax=Senna tora TaxID=362788 RepID=A0A834TH76_9FABA|nr:uncharacterized protein G2W53_026295 [Senna tora]
MGLANAANTLLEWWRATQPTTQLKFVS